MWLMTKYGFYSAVCARKTNRANSKVDPDRVMVRARKREHLEALVDRLTIHLREGDRSDMLDWSGPMVVIAESEGTDYPFRLFVPKDVWADAVHDLVTEIAYDNFKSAAHAEAPDDAGYDTFLHAVWAAGTRMESPRTR